METILILSDIRSNENVGSLFRTSDAVGVTKIILAGYTPSPTDRFGRPVSAIAKTALGAEKTIPWEKQEDILSVIRNLKEKGYTTIAIEQSSKSVDYKSVIPTQRTAFILGNEVDGLPERVLENVDVIAEIGMKGEKESLNVAVAAGVALFRILDR